MNQVAISIEGMSGKTIVIGNELQGLFSIDKALDIIEKALLYYKENAIPGERFANTVERIGFETVEKFLLNSLGPLTHETL
ncbi:hypothetical protein UNSWDHB_2922 [Dehalobacter sp. UNSWDHB]|uniref:hypothetical protein n=1 Tax=Dehalobacter TaxID=56112 RepID=UPI0003878F8A|nr:hypothetical protein [Dehalobacter sp. UNSWDHB]EQB22790.1 hypothetical protein UNSWDHB_2922 [Dehalobacter sp. UNSWDHB]